ncbi:MICOS complex subunit MIC27-like [Panonychus citri]|uniref:MICOS complex subunit MIC27-like n=1 Tax=Panonychus citri TaxID=50023 RepID=UPI0023078965|nr:MICOS complex subunit MIC27-like [Panonychus citri]XP_053206437.1 MICOS complex subunit MIC27-like [Panonychus citri]
MTCDDKSSGDKPCCKGKQAKLVTIDQLPLYGNPYPPMDKIETGERGMIEEGIGTVRVAIMENLKFLDGFTGRAKEIFETAKAHSMTTLDYITDETNTVPKALAITGSGLFGLLLASRRGFFKKLLYTSAGVGIATGVCYPKQSEDILDLAGYVVKTNYEKIVAAAKSSSESPPSKEN